ncbi:hypothetical protein TSUD_269980 [Trifolium subterraneum]|uniref:Uncharacterized protein n=1 Tax=Trifolium subterraneum TaxID=3900 RepID=A0A2Z6MU31_TRISU|nr:hypothetical protein TSUD_269980 [Trifolium subterraneum]
MAKILNFQKTTTVDLKLNDGDSGAGSIDEREGRESGGARLSETLREEIEFWKIQRRN